MTRGDLWDVVAVPDIRIQVSALARRLVKAHWGARGFGGGGGNVRNRPKADLSCIVSFIVTLNLLQGPWSAVSFGAALKEMADHGS